MAEREIGGLLESQYRRKDVSTSYKTQSHTKQHFHTLEENRKKFRLLSENGDTLKSSTKNVPVLGVFITQESIPFPTTCHRLVPQRSYLSKW